MTPPTELHTSPKPATTKIWYTCDGSSCNHPPVSCTDSPEFKAMALHDVLGEAALSVLSASDPKFATSLADRGDMSAELDTLRAENDSLKRAWEAKHKSQCEDRAEAKMWFETAQILRAENAAKDATIEAMQATGVDKARAWDAIAEKNRTIAELREQLLKLRGHILYHADYAETRIKDGKELGANVWRLALEDIVAENRAALASSKERTEHG